jgi:hypothetical protein
MLPLSTHLSHSPIPLSKGKYNYNKITVKMLEFYFCLMMERFGAGSVLVTNGSGFGSGRTKNIRKRIRNTARNKKFYQSRHTGTIHRPLNDVIHSRCWARALSLYRLIL